jgi:hypothetical protein
MIKLNEKTQVHSMFRGNVDEIVASVEKNKIRGQILNANIKISLEMISIQDLIPLETQRETSGKWVADRLKDIKGYDILAAGALSVARDPNDNKNYVFDGCGRLALAQINGAPQKLPCLVYDIPKDRAAYYFAYNQDRGRRNLDKETIFVNAVYSGDSTTDEQVKLLKYLDCFIQGKTSYAVGSKNFGNPEVKYMIITRGLQKANNDKKLMRTVRDLICNAWTQKKDDEKYNIWGDLYTGLIYFLQVYPEAQSGSLRETLQEFLAWKAVGTPQSALKWKRDGGQIENNQDYSVAMGLGKEFLSYLNQDKENYPSYRKIITLKKLTARFEIDQRKLEKEKLNKYNTDDDYEDDYVKVELREPMARLFNL